MGIALGPEGFSFWCYLRASSKLPTVAVVVDLAGDKRTLMSNGKGSVEPLTRLCKFPCVKKTCRGRNAQVT